MKMLKYCVKVIYELKEIRVNIRHYKGTSAMACQGGGHYVSLGLTLIAPQIFLSRNAANATTAADVIPIFPSLLYTAIYQMTDLKFQSFKSTYQLHFTQQMST